MPTSVSGTTSTSASSTNTASATFISTSPSSPGSLTTRRYRSAWAIRKEIGIVGYDISGEDWRFVKEDTFASKGRHPIDHGPLKRFEKQFLQTAVVPWRFFASNLYHNVYWYPVVGRKRAKDALQTKWGQLLQQYGAGKVVLPGPEPGPTALAAGGLATMVMAVALGIRALRLD